MAKFKETRRMSIVELERWMGTLELAPKELAALAGVTPSAVYYWLNGKRAIPTMLEAVLVLAQLREREAHIATASPFVRGCLDALVRSVTSDDETLNRDIIAEAISELAYPVYRLEWDSGGPGAGAGTESVYELAGQYFTASADFGWDGPFPSLDSALGGTVWVSGATREISCLEWSDAEIISRMQLYDPQPWIIINGNRWALEQVEHVLEHGRPAESAA